MIARSRPEHNGLAWYLLVPKTPTTEHADLHGGTPQRPVQRYPVFLGQDCFGAPLWFPLCKSASSVVKVLIFSEGACSRCEQ